MQPLFIAASQLLGKDAVRGKVITDAEKRRITIEVRPAQSSPFFFCVWKANADSGAHVSFAGSEGQEFGSLVIIWETRASC